MTGDSGTLIDINAADGGTFGADVVRPAKG